MDAYLIWLILALVLLGAEMMLSTIYLLACTSGWVASCITAVLGGNFTSQCYILAIVTIVGVIIAYTYRRKIRKLSPNTDCNDLDKGQRVVVEDVLTDGSAKVNYRGALWTAYLNEGNLTKGTYFVEKVEGTRLILTK